jgi:hypothetical protein
MEQKVSLLCSQGPTTGPYVSQFDALHIIIPYFFRIHLNIIFPSTLTSSEWFFPSGIHYVDH